MAPTRILQSLATLDRGGAEAMIMSLYRNINRSQIQFDFLVNERDAPYAFEEEVLQLGGRIFKIPKFNGRNLRIYRKKVHQIFEKHQDWKIIHIHNTSSAMLFMDIAKRFGMKTIAHAHFDHDLKEFRAYIQKILRKPIKHRADYLLACSRLSGAYVFNIPKEDVRVLNNAIETEDYLFNEQTRKRKRAKLGIKYETVIGHVGRMDDQKNHDFLIDVFREYQRLNPKSLLMLVGTGELREKLEKKVEEYGLTDTVLFLGVRADVNELLQAMDIFVFPSVFEGLPVTLVEAQAAGLPILASNRITEDVAITNLITFKSIDVEPLSWAKELDDLYVLLRRNMKQEIKDAGYDVKQTVKELEEYYQNIMKEGD